MKLLTKKTRPSKDWHPADIRAALEKSGWSFNQLSQHHGYTCESALARAQHRPWPKAERLIADAIGVKPEVIWPSRYNADGTTNRPRGRQPLRPANAKGSTGAARRNPQARRSA